MRVLNVKDNNLVDPNLEGLEARVASGEYAFEKGVEVPVTSPDGKRGLIPAEDAAKAFSQGFSFVSPRKIAQEEKEKEFGEGIAAEATAGALGAARGLTFGLSDQALTRLGAMKPESLKLYRDLNPTSSLLGEIGGTVSPALLSGGSSLLARGAAKTLPSIAMKAGVKSGEAVGKKITGKIANKTVSKIVENASKAAAGSAVEGALYGGGQLISEEALGDAEFNAENLIAYTAKGAAIGGITGGAIPLVGEIGRRTVAPLKKRLDKSILRQFGLNQKQADDVLNKQASDEFLQEITEEVKKKNYPEIKKAAEKLGVTPTAGMTSDNKLIQELESSLSQAPTLAGQQVKKEVDAVYDSLEQATKGIFSTNDSSILRKTNLSRFEAGEAIKTNIVADIGERVGQARVFYEELADKFGDAQVSDRIKNLLKTRLTKSDSARLFKSKEVDRIGEMIDAIGTVNDAQKIRTFIGKELSTAYRAGDYNRVDILDDAYKTITRLREKSIVENAGSEAASIIKGLKEANKTYASVFNDFQDVSNALKIGKVRNVDQLSRSLNDMESEKIAERFFSKKNFANNQRLKELFPESFETARKVKLAEIWEKSQTGGDISVKKFINNLKKLGKEETDMIFGADKRESLDALEVLINSMPDKVGPSGTAQALDLFNLFSVTTQTRDGIRWLLYKKGEKGINKYLNETLDVFKQIEKSNNSTKRLLSESVEDFLGKARPSVTVATLNAGESSDFQKALEYMTEFESDPDGTLDKVTEKNKIIFDNAPRTSEAMSGKMMQVYQFLKEKTPNTYDGMSYFRKYEPSKSAKSKFMRYYNYANNPYRVLEDLKGGFVNPEGVETLRSLYPRIYEELYNETTSRVGEEKEFSYPQKRNLYKLLSIVGEASLIPKNLKMLQGQLQQDEEQIQDNKKNVNELRVTGLRKVSQADRFATNVDKSLRKS